MAPECHPGPVTPSDDLSPPRRPIFFPVVIATVFLTIIGMTAGFVLGERKRGERTGQQQQQQQQQQEPEPTADVPSSAATGPLCPPETLAIAEELQLPTDLRQVLKIQTDNGTTVWICQDNGGRYYYQGKTGGLDEPLVQHKNGLFLTDVVPEGEDEYRAVADNGNRIFIGPKRLEIRFTTGKTQTDEVVSVE